jgi:hypothetical protein
MSIGRAKLHANLKEMAASLAAQDVQISELVDAADVLKNVVASKENVTFLKEDGTYNVKFSTAAARFLALGIAPTKVPLAMDAALDMCDRTADKVGSVGKVRRVRDELAIICLSLAGQKLAIPPERKDRTFMSLYHDATTKGQNNSKLTKELLGVKVKVTIWDKTLTKVESEEIVTVGIGTPASGSAEDETACILQVVAKAYLATPCADMHATDAVLYAVFERVCGIISDGASNALKVGQLIAQIRVELASKMLGFENLSPTKQAFYVNTVRARCEE